MTNILMAAIQLVAILRPPEQVRGITGSEIQPSDGDGFGDVVLFSDDEALRSCGLNEKELQYARRTFRRNPEVPIGDGGAQERTALELALFVSPIYLLIPSILMKKRFGRRHIAEVSILAQKCCP